MYQYHQATSNGPRVKWSSWILAALISQDLGALNSAGHLAGVA